MPVVLATKQWTLEGSLGHFSVIIQIDKKEKNNNDSQHLAIVYDDRVCRKRAELAAGNDPKLNFSNMCCKRNKKVYNDDKLRLSSVMGSVGPKSSRHVNLHCGSGNAPRSMEAGDASSKRIANAISAENNLETAETNANAA